MSQEKAKPAGYQDSEWIDTAKQYSIYKILFI
jgi:hypothetical protein